MRDETFEADIQSAEALLAQVGEPEEVFQPSRGQTVAGIVAGFLIAVTGLGFAVFTEDESLRARILFPSVLVVVGLALAYWIYRQRKWRVVICTKGLIQVRSWAIDKIAWADVSEVIATQFDNQNFPFKMTIVGSAKKIKIQPINLQSPGQLFQTLLDAARRNDIPIRIEWKVYNSD